MSEGESARWTLGGGSIRTYISSVVVEFATRDRHIRPFGEYGTTRIIGAVVVECAARDGQITVVVGDGTTSYFVVVGDGTTCITIDL